MDDAVPASREAALISVAVSFSRCASSTLTGSQLGEGRKSLAYALTFRAADRTLTEDEASQWRAAAVEAAEKAVGASLRV